MSRSFHCLVFLGVVYCAAIVGCGPPGPKTVPVQGTLTIDGKPADGVMITLAPIDTSMALATGRATNGSFELFTGVQGAPGAVPGKYKVVLAVSPSSNEEAAKARYAGGAKPGATSGSPSPDAKTVLPFAEKYSSSATTDKEVEITSGKNNLTIDVSSK